jgi:hypothetical protein
MEAVRTSETSVGNHFTRQDIPEDNSEQTSAIDLAFNWERSQIQVSETSFSIRIRIAEHVKYVQTPNETFGFIMCSGNYLDRTRNFIIYHVGCKSKIVCDKTCKETKRKDNIKVEIRLRLEVSVTRIVSNGGLWWHTFSYMSGVYTKVT